MALVTGRREIRGLVIRVCGAVVVRLVAVIARCRLDVITTKSRIVAVGALPRRHGVQTCQRESGRRMVELAISPGDRVVALFAGGRECRVRHRRGRVVVIGLMARHARGHGNAVVVVNVAVGTSAWRHRMRPRQRESGVVVIEDRIRPRRSAVALIARRREI